MIHADIDVAHRADFGVVGDRGDRPAAGIEHLDGDASTMAGWSAALTLVAPIA